MNLGRSMTLIGFAIMLIVALSACSKKDTVNQPTDDLGIFEIALPDTSNNPDLRDYTSAGLGIGSFEVSRIGFRLESWPNHVSPGFKAELRHTLGVVGIINSDQDKIQFSNVRTDGGDPVELLFSFEYDQKVTFTSDRYNPLVYPAGYEATIGNTVSIVERTIGGDLSRVSEILYNSSNKIDTGVYQDGDTQVIVVKTSSGFSVYFVLYEDNVRAIGRIDYLQIN